MIYLENIATYTIWGIAGLELPMKVVVSCDKLEKAIAISLVTASEDDVGQTESRTVRYVEMWCFRV